MTVRKALPDRAEMAALILRAGVGAGALSFEGHAGSAAREAAIARYEALKDGAAPTVASARAVRPGRHGRASLANAFASESRPRVRPAPTARCQAWAAVDLAEAAKAEAAAVRVLPAAIPPPEDAAAR